ncbi:gem-associated protein 2 isoform X2 [Anthonomus grandis grandis]|uniref:gem-associated protein 2 isoform X2 n=1 Tax=Anthonomus grandis grandis TaxID=2921223 RepID=UPI0021661CC6|nr:gem-associated protein 2 isoform X2 [Anthonomus grandis grandis]
MSFSDSDSSEESDLGLLKKALDVTLPDDFDPNSVPQSGVEFLQHVIFERTQCKQWVTATKDFTKYNEKQNVHGVDVPKALQKFYPTKQWQDKTINDLTQLKTYIKNSQTFEPTKIFIRRGNFFDRLEHGVAPPTLSEIGQYCQSAKVRMFSYMTEVLEDFDPLMGISDNLGTWAYGLLALLEKPLTPDCCFQLREFAKKCASIRASLGENIDNRIAIPLNVFICIVARCYDQLDLLD